MFKIKKQDWALASLGVLAEKQVLFSREMLDAAIKSRFNEKVYTLAMETIAKMY